MSNNETVTKVEIKRRGDGVYDVYGDGKLIKSCGSAISAANEAQAYLEALRDSAKVVELQ